MFHFKTKQFFLLFAVLICAAHPAFAWDDEEQDDNDRSSRYETPDDIQNRYHSRHTDKNDRETPVYERAKILRDTSNPRDYHEPGSSWRRQVMQDSLNPAYEEEDFYIRRFPDDERQ
jgi:hypothetical protein